MIIHILKKIILYPLLYLIKIYQLMISPLLKNNCRYLPTCSEYTIESLKKYGLYKGLILSVKRILKCHPFGGYCFDPVPKKKIK